MNSVFLVYPVNGLKEVPVWKIYFPINIVCYLTFYAEIVYFYMRVSYLQTVYPVHAKCSCASCRIQDIRP